MPASQEKPLNFVDDGCCVSLAWKWKSTVLFCSHRNPMPRLQQPKPRLPTNLSSAHSNICSSFCHNRVYKGLLQCLLLEELWEGIIFLQHCEWVLVKMRITWDSQEWVLRLVSRACAPPLTGVWQKLRVEEKISSFKERGGYGRLSCCVAAPSCLFSGNQKLQRLPKFGPRKIPLVSSIEQSGRNVMQISMYLPKTSWKDWRNDFCSNLCDPKVECRAQ